MRLGARRPVRDINVTPLVDVVLVLLIVFMVMTPLAEKQMPMRVPERGPDARPVSAERVPPDGTVLTVRRDGRVLLDSQERTLDDALARLHAAYTGQPSRVLFFDAEDGVTYDAAMRVLDLARREGVETIGLLTGAPAGSGSR